MERMDGVLARHPFDFILGSLHHPFPVYRQWLRDKGIQGDDDIVETRSRRAAQLRWKAPCMRCVLEGSCSP
jgi:hypothetical protein